MYHVRNATLDDVRALLPYSTEGGKVTLETVETSDEIKVFLYNDKPLMILGLEYLPTGNQEIHAGLWGLFSREVDKHTKALVRACKDLIFDRVGFSYAVLIDESNRKYSRFVEFFGFQRTECVERIEEMLYRIYIKR